LAVSKSLVVTEYCVVVAVTVLCHVLNIIAPVPKELQADLAVKMDSFENSFAKESREDVMDETRLVFPFFVCIILQRITADRL